MWKRPCFAFVLVVLLVAGCGKAETGGGGLILYTIPDDMSTLRVVDPAGKEQRRITLDGDPSFHSQGLEAGNLAVYFTDKSAFLVDAAAGTARRLDLPAEVLGDLAVNRLSSVLMSPPRDTFVLGTPLGNAASLVDAKTGEVSDLLSMHEEMRFVFSGQFSADGDYLALVGRDLWLVPTADPASARRLGEGAVGAGSFSSDGKQIAYLQYEAGEFEVIVEQVDGSASEVVATGEFFWLVAFVPRENQLVLARQDGLSLLSLKNGEEKELLACSGTPQGRLWFSPSGRKLLSGYDQEGTLYWYLVDLKGAAEQILGDLEGYPYLLYLEDTSHRWLFFADTMAITEGVRFASLDVESGEVHSVVGLDEGAKYWPSAFSPRDGLAVAQATDPYQSWLIQAETGQARALPEGYVAASAVSPDGRWAVAQQRDAGAATSTLTIVELGGDRTVPLGEGIMPIWVHP